MPLIAITACRKLEDYRQAILHGGGEVRVVDASMTPDAALEGTGGLLLTGGDDVAPALYGQQAHTTVVPAEPGRDEFELALAREARARQLPVLAICRGLQVLNVACGGTLVQDIPSEVPGALPHSLDVPPHQPMELAHEIWIERDTRLAAVLGDRISDADTCEVNSRHHQAVKNVAPGFRVSATSPDGVIEAVEDPAAPFCIGVQWHPENFWRTGEFRPLFEGFLEAAKAGTP
ncbi:MAG: gamma-glutamyl-gamma-aminobutyrate hydrolase family protein [Betaproteobacteria bacterium]